MPKIVPFKQQVPAGAKPPKINIARWIKKAGLIYSAHGLEIRVDQKNRTLAVSHVEYTHIVANPFIIVAFDRNGDIASTQVRTPIKIVVSLLLAPHKKLPLVKALLRATSAPAITKENLRRASFENSLVQQTLTSILTGSSYSSPTPRDAEFFRLVETRRTDLMIEEVEILETPPEKKLVPFPPQNS